MGAGDVMCGTNAAPTTQPKIPPLESGSQVLPKSTIIPRRFTDRRDPFASQSITSGSANSLTSRVDAWPSRS